MEEKKQTTPWNKLTRFILTYKFFNRLTCYSVCQTGTFPAYSRLNSSTLSFCNIAYIYFFIFTFLVSSFSLELNRVRTHTLHVHTRAYTFMMMAATAARIWAHSIVVYMYICWNQIKIMPLFKFWCISHRLPTPHSLCSLQPESAHYFTLSASCLSAYTQCHAAYRYSTSGVCICELTFHMCIIGVIPGEIKYMSRRNMHILPAKNGVWERGKRIQACWLCGTRGGAAGWSDVKTSYMSKRAFSGDAKKFCVVNSFVSRCLYTITATTIKTYLFISCHIIRWHTRNCSFIVVKTSKQFAHIHI